MREGSYEKQNLNQVKRYINDMVRCARMCLPIRHVQNEVKKMHKLHLYLQKTQRVHQQRTQQKSRLKYDLKVPPRLGDGATALPCVCAEESIIFTPSWLVFALAYEVLVSLNDEDITVSAAVLTPPFCRVGGSTAYVSSRVFRINRVLAYFPCSRSLTSRRPVAYLV